MPDISNFRQKRDKKKKEKRFNPYKQVARAEAETIELQNWLYNGILNKTISNTNPLNNRTATYRHFITEFNELRHHFLKNINGITSLKNINGISSNSTNLDKIDGKTCFFLLRSNSDEKPDKAGIESPYVNRNMIKDVSNGLSYHNVINLVDNECVYNPYLDSADSHGAVATWLLGPNVGTDISGTLGPSGGRLDGKFGRYFDRCIASNGKYIFNPMCLTLYIIPWNQNPHLLVKVKRDDNDIVFKMGTKQLIQCRVPKVDKKLPTGLTRNCFEVSIIGDVEHIKINFGLGRWSGTPQPGIIISTDRMDININHLGQEPGPDVKVMANQLLRIAKSKTEYNQTQTEKIIGFLNDKKKIYDENKDSSKYLRCLIRIQQMLNDMRPATYFDLIKAAIVALKEPGGSSRQAIIQYISAGKGTGFQPDMFNRELNTAVEGGELIHVKDKDSFKLAGDGETMDVTRGGAKSKTRKKHRKQQSNRRKHPYKRRRKSNKKRPKNKTQKTNKKRRSIKSKLRIKKRTLKKRRK